MGWRTERLRGCLLGLEKVDLLELPKEKRMGLLTE
jgi:hypothetical protein